MAVMNYRLTDTIADPVGDADRHHCEKLIRLPQGFLCYAPPGDVPDVSEPPAFKNARITFGSFNNLSKVNRAVVSLWSEILHGVPGSALMLKSKQLADEATQKRYLEMFSQEGIEPQQIVFIAYSRTTREHMACYNDIDIALDPMPYNGTTTTCEAMWMGVPVVVLKGERHAARVGASIVTRVGMPEWAAASKAAYVAKAMELAGNPKRLAAIRASLRGRMRTSALCNADFFAGSVEKSYRQMWQEWCSREGHDQDRGASG
jgi:predicted O-linked N-acetylglucosamine transferase (SPINDLY family)